MNDEAIAAEVSVLMIERHPDWAGQDWIEKGVGCLCAEHAQWLVRLPVSVTIRNGTQAGQQTLRAAVDWSYDLLNDPERLLLNCLSVFAGGWTLEAAEAVCPGDGICRGRQPLFRQDPLGYRVFATLSCLLGAQEVGQSPRGDRDQPRARTIRGTVLWPLQRGRDQGLLDRVFGCVEMAVTPDHGAQDLRRQMAQQVLQVGGA